MPDTCYPIGFLCLSNKIDVALIITILFFLAGILLNSKRDRKLHKTALEEEAQKQTKIREEEAQKQAEIRKRYQEEMTLNSFPNRAKLCELLRADKKNRPLITFNYYSVIYRNRLEVLQDLPDLLINNIVDFYGKLDILAVNIDAIGEIAFETISEDGRETLILHILEQLKLAHQQGESVLTPIELQLRPS